MGQVYYCKQFFEKVFVGASVKDAYISATRWYANNIIANDKIHGVCVEFIRNKTEHKILMRVYSNLAEGEVRDQHCECCREMHHAFFINQEADCNRCNMLGFQKRLDHKIDIKANYCKEQIENSRRISNQ